MNTVEWQISDSPVGYAEATEAMERRVEEIRAGTAPELIWLLEHPPLYTAGTSARASDLLAPDRLPVFPTGRGGQYTYHGPGQRIAYVMLDLRRRDRDVRRFVCDLETWLIAALAGFGVAGRQEDGRIGVWVDRGRGRGVAKIAAIGVRIRHWITYHGVSLNIEPDLAHYGGIVPCGIEDAGVTSLVDLGVTPSMAEVDAALQHCFTVVFGELAAVPATDFARFAAG
ncbi:MAG: lipoyl(octanoyl) transferase LipB [Proteobacteria bacterium]|nr:lipoyl(octanoyl) transferase LipB [Pseudomonadota bacterium]MDA1059517.1 lipoyl(octanoyl) transferase LipB [Pseudomonadota bacterium]